MAKIIAVFKSEKKVQEAIDDLEYRFSAVRGDSVMEELLAVVKEYLLEKQGENDG